MNNILQCGARQLDLNQPQVMGILNVTPDSFSDGGLFIAPNKALDQAIKMVSEGAAIIDVGGESTRPGADAVTVQQELDRVIPVIEAITAELDTIVSIDTSKPEVMRAAVEAGAEMINDVCALRAEGALETAAQLDAPVCLMHMQGEPRTMQQDPQYDDVVNDVKDFLVQRANSCIEAGITKDHIIIDPGFGFGKTVDHNYSLIKHLDQFVSMDYPVLVGVSRKSMIGAVLNNEVSDRLSASVALAAMACRSGAHLFRVHDVKATADALAVCRSVRAAV